MRPILARVLGLVQDFGLLSKQNRTSRFIYTVSAFILMLRVDGTRSNLAS